jgi:hypothetical protein
VIPITGLCVSVRTRPGVIASRGREQSIVERVVRTLRGNIQRGYLRSYYVNTNLGCSSQIMVPTVELQASNVAQSVPM